MLLRYEYKQKEERETRERDGKLREELVKYEVSMGFVHGDREAHMCTTASCWHHDMAMSRREMSYPCWKKGQWVAALSMRSNQLWMRTWAREPPSHSVSKTSS